jgi:hypothetical protein
MSGGVVLRAGAIGGSVVGRPRCSRIALITARSVMKAYDPPAATAGAGEHVLAEDALEQLRPRDLGVWPARLRGLSQWGGYVRSGWRRRSGCGSSMERFRSIA